MSASTITGRGPGAANHQKGPGNARDTFIPLTAPRIIAAGHVRLDADGLAQIAFSPPLPGEFLDYAITANYVGNLPVSVGGSENEEGVVSIGFGVAGGDENFIVHYQISTTGFSYPSELVS